MHVRIAEPATTLVWIDSEEAIIVRWADRATVERVRSDVPGPAPFHRPRPSDRPATTVAGPGRKPPNGLAERGLPPSSTTWPGSCHRMETCSSSARGWSAERLERDIRAEDRQLGRHRHVHAAPAERLTEEELVARVRELAGEAPKRRACRPRWPG